MIMPLLNQSELDNVILDVRTDCIDSTKAQGLGKWNCFGRVCEKRRDSMQADLVLKLFFKPAVPQGCDDYAMCVTVLCWVGETERRSRSY